MTGAAILAQAGKGTPTAADTAWADICAAAVDAAITTALNGYTVVALGPAALELTRCALADGVGAYMDRDAPQGVLMVGPDGAPVRLRADILRVSVPVVARYAIPGIG